MSGHVNAIAKAAAEAVLRDRMHVAAIDMPPTVSDALDAWIADQPNPKPSRQEVVREALTAHLKTKGYLT
ncbi:hypothetical protein [Methylobacterium sp. WL7]|uniref:hypothetical protein n=1 Tax=Methylobacterium sp. WL7 TaxID=2603900 RepID=UPI0011C86B44|nr:hypothetical protein [Methylobacterium sp. WL7]TXN44625.1 hypothetical protein FV233_13940 [Methylobacterium sp. WL7]